MKSSKTLNIGIITSQMGDPGKTPIAKTNVIDILYPLSNDIYLITDNVRYDLFKKNKKIHIYGIQYKMGTSAFTKFIRYTYLQLRISYKLIKITKNVDMWIFLGTNLLALPILTVKLLRKNVVLALLGSYTLMAKFSNTDFYMPEKILEKITYTLSNRIILHSPNLIKEWDLEKYRNKICIAHEHFLDFDKFKIKKKFNERDNLIGYIGRLSEEKGVFNFVKAIPEILKEGGEVKFLVGGDGQLRDKIEEYLDVASLNDKVKLTGWIPDEEFSTYLNELKLFVLPSYTEGLPHTLLEAMACGTPVLATPVGAIPDVIKDGETGFIMENNSPECIAKNIVRALAHPNINEITKNAR
ncbi:glycosyltransferase family 4 protein, partial [candidate division WOR-3 bacterium]|nr:glycosyltransferase family 4 protein [candidate division WOR-3 bacterium]